MNTPRIPMPPKPRHLGHGEGKAIIEQPTPERIARARRWQTDNAGLLRMQRMLSLLNSPRTWA